MTLSPAAKVAVGVFEAWNERDFDRGLSLVSEDCEIVEVASAEVFRGREGLLAEYTKWAAALPDGRIQVVRVVDKDDWVAIESVVQGTHTGPFVMPNATLAPTGRKIALPFCTFAQVEHGQEVCERHYMDLRMFEEQFGIRESNA